MKSVLSVPAVSRILPDAVPAWRQWVAGRPPHIQEAIRRFPPGTTGTIKGEQVWVLGWGEIAPPAGVTPSLEHVMLLFTTVPMHDPDRDYDEARREEHIRRACAAHFVTEEE